MTEGQYYPPQQLPPGQYPPPPYGVPPPNSSKATTSLILGIVSIVACGLLLGIPAMVLGRQAKREIQQSQGQLGGDGLATAGFVTGLIGTIWSVIAFVIVILVFAFGTVFAHDFAQNCTTTTDANGNSTFDCTRS